MSLSIETPRLKSAALTFLAAQIREWGKQAVNLVAWPLIVNGLSLQTYGLWVLVNQVASYVQLSDLRVSSVLGLLLARERRSTDDDRKRRLIGAHLRISSLISLLIATIGIAVVIGAPTMFHLKGDEIRIFRISMGIAVLGVMIAPFLAVPNMVLYSQNQAYKGFRYLFAFDLLGPILCAGAVLAGLGLIGLSGVTLSIAVISSAVLLVVARQHLPWIGVRKPAAVEMKQMLGNGVRYQLDGLAYMLSENSAAILLGWMCGMKEVAVFAVTERLLRVSQIMTNRLCNAAAPVVGEFAGLADQQGLRRAWSLLTGVNNAVAVGAFLVVMPLNTLFLDVLLGPGKHGGELLSFLLALKVLMISRSAPAAYFMNQMLQLKAKNRWSLLWVLAVLISSLLLVPRHGLVGMAASMLISAVVVQQGYTWQVFKSLGYGKGEFLRDETLPLISVVAAGAALVLSVRHFELHGLVLGLLAAVGLALCASGCVWWMVLRGDQRDFVSGFIRRFMPARGVSV